MNKQVRVKDYRYILKTVRLLKEHQPWKLVLVFVLTLVMGVNSGFSIMLLVPLLQLLKVGGDAVPDGPAMFFSRMASSLGVTLSIELILVIYVSLISINALLRYWSSLLDARYQQSLIYGLRRRLFRKIIMADWRELNSKSKTNHIQVLTKEVPNMANYVYFYLRLLTTLIVTVCYTAYALAVNPLFTLIIIVTGAALFLLLRRYLSRSFSLGEEVVSSYNRLLKYIDDFWQTVKIAKVHSSEDFHFNKFDEATSSLLDLEFRMQRNWSTPKLIYNVTGILVLVLIVYIGYSTGSVPVTSFFVLILLFSRIFPQFVSLNTDVNMIISNLASVRMVMQLDEEFAATEFRDRSGGSTLEPDREIRLDHLAFAYDDGMKLFSDFTETIPARSITGIIGESGIGKTTLIDLIAGLQRPDAGKIMIDDVALDENNLPSWKAGIGYLPQDPFFIDGTIRENLVWDSGDIADEQIWTTLEAVNADHLVKRFEKGLDAFIANYQFTFSGGECQRLSLARVLLRKPRILLLDEATSSLDTENEAVIMEVITRLRKDITVIFVTHRTTLLPYFDKVIKL